MPPAATTASLLLLSPAKVVPSCLPLSYTMKYIDVPNVSLTMEQLAAENAAYEAKLTEMKAKSGV